MRTNDTLQAINKFFQICGDHPIEKITGDYDGIIIDTGRAVYKYSYETDNIDKVNKKFT